jgi:protein involved in sex pheromone biosynthesis
LYKFFKEGKNWTKDLLVAASNPSSSKKKNTWDDIKNLKVLMPPGDSAPSEKKLSEVLVQYDKTID